MNELARSAGSMHWGYEQYKEEINLYEKYKYGKKINVKVTLLQNLLII